MIKKTPKPATTTKTAVRMGIKTVLWSLIWLLLVVLALFYSQNKNANDPLFVKSDGASSNARSTLYVFIDPARHRDDQKLLQTFAEHRPDIELVKLNDTTGDKNTYVILGEPLDPTSLSAFDYALQDEIPLVGYMSDDNAPNLAFRDFLLSSVAQDIFIETGFDSIEPYRNLSNAYFDSPKGSGKTADKTATQAVSGTALITAP